MVRYVIMGNRSNEHAENMLIACRFGSAGGSFTTMNHDNGHYQDAQTDSSKQAAAVAVLSKMVIITNFFVTLVLITGIYFDHRSTTTAVLSGVGYFAASTTFVISVLSGTVRDVAVEALRQRTAQKQIEVGYKIHMLQVVDAEPDDYTVSQEAVQLPWTRNFVPANPFPTIEGQRKNLALQSERRD